MSADELGLLTEPGTLPRVAVAQLGARHHYAVPRVLHEAGMLEHFFTDSYSGNKPMLRRVAAATERVWSSEAGRRWLSRDAPDLPPEKVTSFERIGFAYAIDRRRMTRAADLAKMHRDVARQFNQSVLQHGLGGADVVYGFNRAGLELFEGARRDGRRCVLDQTLAPAAIERALLTEEIERWPNWQPDLEVGGAERAAEREAREWEAVDVILCPSRFVSDGVAAAGGPVSKCRIVPYGVDTSGFPHRPVRRSLKGRPLHVLFAGQVGLRKGAPYLLEALRQLGPSRVEGRFVGPLALAPDRLEPYGAVASFLGSVPRSAMPDHYAWADVLVLPSLCEGSAGVINESLASGLPVICTPNSGPPPATSGLHLIPVRDVDALAAALLDVRDRYADAVPQLDGDPPVGLAAYASRLEAQMLDVVGVSSSIPGARAAPAAASSR